MLKMLTLTAVAASLALSAPAMAFPNGPKNVQNVPQPKLPGPMKPGVFKLPPKPGPKAPKGGFNNGAAFGALLGVGILTAAAIAASADDEECWQEERDGDLVTVCVDR